MNNTKQEGILIGRDRLGRGILLTPEGDYRRAFVSRDAVPGDVVSGNDKSFIRAASLSAALAGAASVLLCLAVSLSANHTMRIAELDSTPNPPRGVIYATLYLNSKTGDPVAVDLDKQGHVVTVRAKGENLTPKQAVGQQIADVLQDKDHLLAGVKVEPGEPLGLQIRAEGKADEDASKAGGQIRSIDTGSTTGDGNLRSMDSENSKAFTAIKKDSRRISTNTERSDFTPPADR